MGIFRNRSHTVGAPPQLNPMTGKPYGAPTRPDHVVDDALYAAGQLALATLQTPEDRRAKREQEAKELGDIQAKREEALWWDSYYRNVGER